jgi:Anti-sigma-K factor rskA
VSAHISEDLPRLLTGEAARDEVLAAAVHLRSCPDCQQELVSAVVAHASLTSAHRFAPQLVTPPTPVDEADLAPDAQLPDISAVFAKARAEAVDAARPASRTRRRLLTVAAAAVLAAGVGVTVAETVGGSSPAKVSAAQTVVLRPVGTNSGTVRATVEAGTMRVDASALPTLAASRQYEVWLTDRAGSRLRALGYIGTDRTAALPVPAEVMAQYVSIAISIQRTDQAEFSGDLVARGYYA